MVFAAVGLPAQVTAVSLARVVDGHYNHLHTLKARFVERYRGAGTDRSESGTLELTKPGKMRWIYDSPAGKMFVVDGKWATLYMPGQAEPQREPAKKLDDMRSPLRLLLGHAELGKELDGLTLTPVEGGAYTLSGVPKGMSARVRRVSITVSSVGTIQGLRMEETDGAVTSFDFSEILEGK